MTDLHNQRPTTGWAHVASWVLEDWPDGTRSFRPQQIRSVAEHGPGRLPRLNSVCPGQVSRVPVSGLAVAPGSPAVGCVCSHDHPAVHAEHTVQAL